MPKTSSASTPPLAAGDFSSALCEARLQAKLTGVPHPDTRTLNILHLLQFGRHDEAASFAGFNKEAPDVGPAYRRLRNALEESEGGVVRIPSDVVEAFDRDETRLLHSGLRVLGTAESDGAITLGAPKPAVELDAVIGAGLAAIPEEIHAGARELAAVKERQSKRSRVDYSEAEREIVERYRPHVVAWFEQLSRDGIGADEARRLAHAPTVRDSASRTVGGTAIHYSLARALELTGGNGAASLGFVTADDARASAGLGTVNVGQLPKWAVGRLHCNVFHEFGHIFEEEDPEIGAAARAWIERRSRMSGA